MPTTVVGFRPGNAVTSRQVTVLVTETGVLHRAHGGYGQPPKPDPPKLPPRYLHPNLAWMKGEHMLTSPISALRDHHTTATKEGYTQVLIAPACVRLDLEEHPMPPKENPHDARPHPELTEAFIGTPPDTAQPLAAAVDAFRAALGLPVRQKNLTWRTRQAWCPRRSRPRCRTAGPARHGRR
ncbi:hypothetical protein [Streptomyces goshikiensis]|uniref:hypothetical protein n=1 Tax=Streptomyces goshikiensis TaxID=1942 RepID=UPI003655CD43